MLLTGHSIAKIADFGLASAFRANEVTYYNGKTELFAAPEQREGCTITPAIDVWGWAASMLAVFTGGHTWQSGSVCATVLREFIEAGGKAHRSPPMPSEFARILAECFVDAPTARLSDFRAIAARVCVLYEELIGEPCPAKDPDLELISADSLNNRAVCRFDLNDIPTVHRLLDAALTVDPLHPEANFNSALLGYFANSKIQRDFIERLVEVTRFDRGEYRPLLYRACLLQMEGRSHDALAALKEAQADVSEHEIPELERLWNLSSQRKLNLVLSPPISGEDFAQDSERFQRLMSKADRAFHEGRLEDANRYLMMSGDIPGFGRHPRRRRALLKPTNDLTL